MLNTWYYLHMMIRAWGHPQSVDLTWYVTWYFVLESITVRMMTPFLGLRERHNPIALMYYMVSYIVSCVTQGVILRVMTPMTWGSGSATTRKLLSVTWYVAQY